MQNSDFLVVGAGINGLLAARNLLAAGGSVTLIDKGAVGKEASWAGGGIISPLYPWRYAAPITALATEAQTFYPLLTETLLEETGIDPEFHACGLLMLDTPEQEAALNWADSENRAMEVWGADKIYDQQANLQTGFSQGLWMPTVGNVRNPRLCQALLASLQRQANFRLETGTELSGVTTNGAAVTSVSLRSALNASHTKASFGTVVLTAGAWTQTILSGLSLQTDITPVKGQMLLFKFPAPPIASILLHEGRYLIPRRDGHVLAGSTLEFEDFDKSTTDSARDALRESAAKILPELAALEPVGQWAGLRPGSAGGLPWIGKLAAYENLFLNAGQYRNGLVLAPASARLVAELVLGETPFIDPGPYQPSVRLGRVDSESFIQGQVS